MWKMVAQKNTFWSFRVQRAVEISTRRRHNPEKASLCRSSKQFRPCEKSALAYETNIGNGAVNIKRRNGYVILWRY